MPKLAPTTALVETELSRLVKQSLQSEQSKSSRWSNRNHKSPDLREAKRTQIRQDHSRLPKSLHMLFRMFSCRALDAA
jgi:hypothetical protein